MATNSQLNNIKEKSTLESKRVKFGEKAEVSKEVQKATIGKETYKEAVNLDESVETTGRVSEIISDSSEQKGSGMKGASAKGFQPLDPDEVRANLLKNIPSEKTMKAQIKREIKDEIDYLHKKAVRLAAIPSGMSYFEMTNLMKKIRELKGLLFSLVKASLDTLKTLWLRFVHGVM